MVATPIGHLSDLGPRAAQTLCAVDVVAAEDTRVTRVLLAHVGSSARLIGARAHNETQAAQTIVALITEGRSVALVSDAGTPAISDPGARVVAAVRAAGHPVVPVPGPSAITVLLSVAGLPDGPVLFEGFLPSRSRARRERLARLADAADPVGAALLLYEAPHRIVELVADLLAHYGPQRGLVIGRELTKLHEEVWRGSLGAAVTHTTQVAPRGEYVVVLEGAPAAANATDEQILAALHEAMGGGADRRAAIATVMAATGAAKRRVYDLALTIPRSADE